MNDMQRPTAGSAERSKVEKLDEILLRAARTADVFNAQLKLTEGTLPRQL